jgi:ergothioneine biosynthesis protein EgtB
LTVDRYQAVRAATVRLASPLAPEDQLVQSMPDASPTKWHLAHTTWFFETFVLARFQAGFRPVDERYRFLFNSYYEALGDRQPRPQRGAITRPSLEEVGEYRERVDAAMATLLDARAASDADLRFRTELGLQHEQQHQELILTDIHHALWRNPLRPEYLEEAGWPARSAARGEPGWIEHPGGLAEIGHDGPGFAFDNEGARHRVHLEPFAIARGPVTSGEFLAFVEAGGYRPSSRKAGRRRSIGSGTAPAGASSPCAVCGRWTSTHPSRTSATTRRTRTRVGRAPGCRRKRSGR